MVARLIHRHAAADRLYPGAVAATLADITRGDMAVFGADASSALAIRDAAHAGEGRPDASVRRVDLGDLSDAANCLPALLHDMDRRGARPCMLGGDAALGAAFVTALAGPPNSAPAIIVLSPRLDVAPPRDRTHHALAIGTQRLIGKRSHDAWREAGGGVIPATACETTGAAEALDALASKASTAILLVDLSIVDTGHAAGATTRNIGGLGPMAVMGLTDRIAAQFEIRGLALLNLAPERDPRGHSERIAAMIAERAMAQGRARQAA